MKKTLVYASLSLFLSGLWGLPAHSGEVPVNLGNDGTEESFNPANQRVDPTFPYTQPIKGATATVSADGRTVTVSVPQANVDRTLEKFRAKIRLQIDDYDENDVRTLARFNAEGTLSEALADAVDILQETDPARAARVAALIGRLNELLGAESTSNLPLTESVLVAANLQAIRGELLGSGDGTQRLAQSGGDAETISPEGEASVEPEIVYDPPLAGIVVESVEAHNEAVETVNEGDLNALDANTSFIVIADILEQIAGELRGEPVPDEELEFIDDIIAEKSA
jgi:hypothetical protein